MFMKVIDEELAKKSLPEEVIFGSAQ